MSAREKSDRKKPAGNPWYFLTSMRVSQGASLLLALSAMLTLQPQLHAAVPAKPAAKPAAKVQPALYNSPVETLINKANLYASQDKFAEAIPLYEQAVPKLPAGDPNAKTIHRNLQVLYVNHAVSLLSNKQYPQAEVFLNKAQKHDPSDVHVKKTLASLYFRQAMDLRDAEQDNIDNQNFEKIELLLKKAMQYDPSEPNVKRALAANYFENGISLAHSDRMDEACTLMEAAHQLEPNNSNIKQSLANVYLSRMHQETDTEKQKAWGEKALALDNSQRIQDLVKQLGQPKTMADEQMSAFGASASDDKRPKMPVSGTKLTLQDMMLDIENQWGIERNPKAKLQDRLTFAEKQINGKEGEGPLAQRIQDLYAQLYGKQPQAQEVAQGPIDISEDALKTSYIAEVFKMTDGKVFRWARFPVRVYIEDPNEKDNEKELGGLYQKEYHQAVLDGIDRWKEASKGSVSYVEVKNELAADIIFRFGKPYVDRFADPDTVPEWYKSYSTPKVNNKLVTGVRLASMFTPGLFSLIPMAVGSGLQYQQYKKLDVIRQESDITLGLEPIAKLPPEQGIVLLQNISAKEFGHALGIKAVSPDAKDLMYPDLVSDHAKFPTKRDIATLMQLYTRPANVLLNVQQQISGRY